MKNQATGEYGNTSRTTKPGYHPLRSLPGSDPFKSLGRGVVESKSHNDLEEEKLFNTSRQVDLLIENLLKMKETEDET